MQVPARRSGNKPKAQEWDAKNPQSAGRTQLSWRLPKLQGSKSDQRFSCLPQQQGGRPAAGSQFGWVPENLEVASD